MSTKTVPTPDASPKAAARWEDFIDVFFSPSELFRRRANDNWWVPIIVLSVLSLIVYYAFLPVNRVIMETAMMSNPQLTEEQRAQVGNMSGAIGLIWGIVVPITMAVMVLLVGFFAWLAGKMTSINLTFRCALMVTAFIGMLTFVQQLVAYLLFSLKVRSGAELDVIRDGSFGILRFIDRTDMNVALVGLLSRIDLFALWQLAWFALAFIAAAKAPKAGAWITAAIVWLAGALPFMLQALGSRA
ncbi:MAG: YIP1 family protein [Longimicrobiales bacterium]